MEKEKIYTMIPSPFVNDFKPRGKFEFFIGVITERGNEKIINLGVEQLKLLSKLLDTLPKIITEKI